MTPVPIVAILTLIIKNRGSNYQIKSVMTGLTIHNYSIFKTSGGDIELFLFYYINFRNTNEFIMYRDDKSQLHINFTT